MNKKKAVTRKGCWSYHHLQQDTHITQLFIFLLLVNGGFSCLIYLYIPPYWRLLSILAVISWSIIEFRKRTHKASEKIIMDEKYLTLSRKGITYKIPFSNLHNPSLESTSLQLTSNGGSVHTPVIRLKFHWIRPMDLKILTQDKEIVLESIPSDKIQAIQLDKNNSPDLSPNFRVLSKDSCKFLEILKHRIESCRETST